MRRTVLDRVLGRAARERVVMAHDLRPAPEDVWKALRC
jgi:hypothetical protein